ncbi:MAG: hypothetical protein ACREE9_18680 [Stellaceae bacterium]
MVGKIIATTVLVLLAIYAFWGGALGVGGVNPFGIFFLLLAVLNWFVWRTIRDGFSDVLSGGDGVKRSLIIRFGPVFTKEIMKIPDTATPDRANRDETRP